MLCDGLSSFATRAIGIAGTMSADTAGVMKDRFSLESRGVVDIKGKGPIEPFLLSV